MDAEGGEWRGLRTLPISYLDNIEQMLIEFHFPGPGMYFQPDVFWGNLDILKTLDKYFASVWMHMNNCYSNYRYQATELHLVGAFAIEVLFVNRKLLNFKSDKRSWA